MKLNQLLADSEIPALREGLRTLPPVVLERKVEGLTADSREVKPGWLFIAVRGTSEQSPDGHRFVDDVRKAGAIAVIGEEPSVCDLAVDDSRFALGWLASAFYGHPSRAMKMIGVTGTSGKTTTTYLLESIWQEAGFEVGVLGTVNFRHRDHILPSTHTTPGAVELQSILAEMRKRGCTAIIMEVSSHALKQQRVAGISFAASAFSNLTPEHLDYHPDLEDYFQSKARLFHDYAGPGAINLDDTHGQRLFADLQSVGREPWSFGWSGAGAVSAEPRRVWGHDLKAGLDGVQFGLLWTTARGKAESIALHSPLIGGFNAANILAAATVSLALGIEPSAIARGVAKLEQVPGRMDRVPNERGIHALVDYAHKPDALDKVLRLLKGIKGSGQLITVFGCGGDRDRTKRPVMGRLAAELADLAIVTSDNPRTEDPQAIIDEVLVGVKAVPKATFVVEPDRRGAIRLAVTRARPGDIILIAGKGHEDYQIIGKTKVHFDDREEARLALAK